MTIQFIAMSIDPSWKAIEKRLKQLGKRRADLVSHTKYSDQRIQNWKYRGVPARELLRVAKFLQCEPGALKDGRIDPVDSAPLLDPAVAENRGNLEISLSQEAVDMAYAYQELPDSLKNHIRLIIDDYIVSIEPVLKRLYSNVRRSDQERFNRIIEEAQARDRARRKQQEK